MVTAKQTSKLEAIRQRIARGNALHLIEIAKLALKSGDNATAMAKLEEASTIVRALKTTP